MRIYTKVEQPYDGRVIVPYVKADHTLQIIVDALRIQFVQPILHKITSDTGYHELLSSEWTRGETFHIVEHDVIVWPGAIALMDGCTEPWCTLPIICRAKMTGTTLGCVKFTAELTQKYPDMWEDIDRLWFTLDAQLANKLIFECEQRPHLHMPAATHLNEVHWPDSISTRYEQLKVWKLDQKDPKNRPLVARMSGPQGEQEVRSYG